MTAERSNKILSIAGYTLLKKIGEGGFSSVYLANSIKNSTEFLVCKKISGKNVQKFTKREVEVLCSMRHPNIIHVNSIYQHYNDLYIFMRYAENGDLFDYISTNGALSEIQCAEWTRQIASAIQYLHTLDIAHRDMKCENILITKNFNLKLCDFGFARIFKENDGGSETYCGSVAYVAPEVINRRPYDPRKADMWSLGVIIYTMLSKANPFHNSVLSLLYRDQIERNWKFSGRCSLLLSAELKEMLKMLLEPIPGERWDIEQFFNSNWIKKFSAVTKLTPEEAKALEGARIKKSQMMESVEQFTSGSIYSSLTTVPQLSTCSIQSQRNEYMK